jgi:hypothetical protein
MNILNFIKSKSAKKSVKQQIKINGLVLHETENIVSIAVLKSANVKTGNMIQVYILTKNISPTEAIKNGDDFLICGNCPQRRVSGGGCYVNVGQDPSSVWRSYKKGQYQKISDMKNWQKYFLGRSVRFGAYGDPAFIPVDIVSEICDTAESWTGYTHQWEQLQEYNAFFMASVENENKQEQAKIQGFRTFKIVDESYNIKKSETVCPNLLDANINCIDCGLCDGYNTKKDIVTLAHGSLKSKVNYL